MKIKSGDFLAGGGGVTHAMTNIQGLDCRWVLNHDPLAIRTNMFHHTGIKHYWADFYRQDEHEMEKVDFLWASIECTQHSKANGGKEKKIGSYTLGWELIRYIVYQDPHMIGIENVPEFKHWAPLRICCNVKKSKKKYSVLEFNEDGSYKLEPNKEKKGEEFKRWKKAICDLGYIYDETIINAADFGIPQRRKRFFCWFVRKSLNMAIVFPKQTHAKKPTMDLLPWNPCGPLIDLNQEGESIFGRKYNLNIPKGKRVPLVHNSLKRIAGGIKKLHPEMFLIMQYYGTGENVQDINSPLNAVVCRDVHALIKLEKLQFIQDYCQFTDIYDKIADPLSPQLTWQTKQLVTINAKKKHIDSAYTRDEAACSLNEPLHAVTTGGKKQLMTVGVSVEKVQHLSDYHVRDDAAQSLDDPSTTVVTAEKSKHIMTVEFVSDQTFSTDQKNLSLSEPLNTQTGQQRHQLMKAEFISMQNNSNGKPENNNYGIDEPAWSVTREEKAQFIATYFSSSGHPETGSVLTIPNKQALITAIANGQIDFDIKMRFLNREELGAIMTFPKGYFSNPRLKLTNKEAIKLIGNAVPPEWAEIIIRPMVDLLAFTLSKFKRA